MITSGWQEVRPFADESGASHTRCGKKQDWAPRAALAAREKRGRKHGHKTGADKQRLPPAAKICWRQIKKSEAWSLGARSLADARLLAC